MSPSEKFLKDSQTRELVSASENVDVDEVLECCITAPQLARFPITSTDLVPLCGNFCIIFNI